MIYWPNIKKAESGGMPDTAFINHSRLIDCVLNASIVDVLRDDGIYAEGMLSFDFGAIFV